MFSALGEMLLKTHILALMTLASLFSLATSPNEAGSGAAIAPPQAERRPAAAPQSPPNGRPPAAAGESYPYRSAPFDELVAESYRVGNAGAASHFYVWLASAYEQRGRRFPGREHLGLEELLTATRRELAAMPAGAAKAEKETAICAWLHRLIQGALPRVLQCGKIRNAAVLPAVRVDGGPAPGHECGRGRRDGLPEPRRL